MKHSTKGFWSLCTKTESASTRAIRSAAALAIALPNNGWSAIESVSKRLNLLLLNISADLYSPWTQNGWKESDTRP